MKLSCIQWWGYSSRALGEWIHIFITTTVRSTLTWSGNTCLAEAEDTFKNCVLGVTWSCIQWWGYSSGVLGEWIHIFITTTVRFALTWSGNTCLAEAEDSLKKCVLGVTWSCIQWWGYSSGVLGEWIHIFITTTVRSALTWSGNTSLAEAEDSLKKCVLGVTWSCI